MKMLLAMISNDDVNEVTERLAKNCFSSACIARNRSFLNAVTTTLVIPVEDSHLDEALHIIQDICSARKASFINSNSTSVDGVILTAEDGGGAVFVLDVEKFVRL